ncbi:MAG: hypothetical protein ACK4YU_06815 [Paracoccus sp. (in: a-proteobacteria)]
MRRAGSRIAKAHFLVYSNGVDPFAVNADDYCASALRVGFDSATHVREDMLKQTPFWDENRFILEQPRGAGYWLWKPWIILQKLRECGPDDIVIYNDAGRYQRGSFAQFPAFPHAAAELCAMLPKRFIHGFISTWQVQGQYTKRDAFILMDADTEEQRYASQVCAGPLLFMPSPESFEFLETWLRYCQDPRALTDQPDELGAPHDEFREHRHDQSVGSILAHKTKAHFFDFSADGASRSFADVSQRNRHVPRIQTHMGYVSLMAARAMPDDFLVRDDADLSEVAHLIRNIDPEQPIPGHPGKMPLPVLLAELEDQLATPEPSLVRDHIHALLDGNRVVNSRLHVLGKYADDAASWWAITCRAFRDRAAAHYAEGTPLTAETAAPVALLAMRDADEQMPDLRQKTMAGYVWGIMSDDARSVFKSAHGNVKAGKGGAMMEKFVARLEELNFLSLEDELAGDDKVLKKEVSSRLMEWMLVDDIPTTASD